MIKSMTGYGRRRETVDGKDIQIEIKSVNNRFLDINVRVPRLYNYLEDKIKHHLQRSISRGKIDASVTINETERKNVNIRVDEAYAESYINSLRQISAKYGLPDDVTVMRVAQNRDIFIIEKLDEDETAMWETVKSTLEKAVEAYENMKATEGEKLAVDMAERIRVCEADADLIDEASKACGENYYTLFRQKLEDFIGGVIKDESRIVMEAAVYADKISITEEIVRLKSHFKQFHQIMKENKPVGRKLEFLLQEINREVNTIGSKSLDLEITNKVIGMKSELEKIREQIQNIE